MKEERGSEREEEGRTKWSKYAEGIRRLNGRKIDGMQCLQ